MAILTASQVKSWIKAIDSSSSTDDTLIGDIINAIDAAMARRLGYVAASTGGAPTLEDTTYTFYLPGPGGTVLRVPAAPIVSITSIEDDYTQVFNGSTYLVSSSDYAARGDDAQLGRIRLLPLSTHSVWSSSQEPVIKAVVVAGYQTVPDEVVQAARFWVQQVYMNLREGLGLERSTAQGGGSMDFRPETMPEPVWDFIKGLCLTGAYFG